MKIFPAIDLYEGQAVRLLKGDYSRLTVYSPDPPAVAQSFEEAGAEWLHMVDLEGARDGGTPNFPVVAGIAQSRRLKVQIGGGIRSEQVVEKYLAAGVSRVILGTAAVENRDFLASAVRRWGEKIAVGVDVKDGFVAVRGWREVSRETLDGFCAFLSDLGVSTVICTDISRDGAMQGTNRDMYRHLTARYPLQFIASGGVSSLEDLTALRGMGLCGAILGKALYTGAVDLRRAIEVAQ